MDHRRTGCFLLCILAFATYVAPGAAAADAPASAVAPFVDEQTVLVARVDLTRLRFDTLTDLFISLVGEGEGKAEMQQQMAGATAMFDQMLTSWTEAGGQEVYVVVTLTDLGPTPAFFVAPLKVEHDIEAVKALWRKLKSGFELELAHGSAVVASPDTLERLRGHRGADLPELGRAFNATGDAAVQVVVRVSDDTRRVIGEMLPQLPAELGGGPSTAVTGGLQWAALSIDISPKIQAHLRIQSTSLESAQALSRVVDAMLLAVSKRVARELKLENWEQMQQTLSPRVQDDALVVDVDHAQAERLLTEVLGPVLRRARASARVAQSKSQMKQLMVACLSYSEDNERKFPPDLATIVQSPRIPPRLLLSPFAQQSMPQDFNDWPEDKRRRWLNANTSYVLVVPGATTANFDGGRIAIIEKVQFSQDRLVTVAYMDGHNASIGYDTAQQAVVEQTGKTLEEWSGLPAPDKP